ncbi:Autophagy-related protein [Wickerhamomyces ciferrii]|uniref:Autophagy-related protein 9 n=1 Tax=Wickerhamomyces ciferrii (strain ATCC 14091 / BCRC 22168 / CBS 111 / JCM 3599 / NBRC 0793 / NRRL Y-1031 F-60-10) TaxID=1206466 RepID=K0KR50_WICCF|nr:Autophagy-related protein [Wickerhamomyces ciferrii]CCH44577.1 Autophagy-related protein [Wickerhamomyces ciferrii]
MTSHQPPTFLSRVFGANSNVRDETELSSIRDGYNSQGASNNHSLLGGSGRGRNRSLIESDQEESESDHEFAYEEDDDDEDDDLYHPQDYITKNDNKNGTRQNSNDTDNPNQLDFINEGDHEQEDVPISIMVQPDNNKQKQPSRETLNRKNSFKDQIGRKINFPKLRSQPPSKPSTSSNQNVQFPVDDLEAQTSYKRPIHENISPSIGEDERARRARLGILNPKERALWRWANVENLDRFLQDVYSYYLGSGYYAILLSRTLDLATLAFVVYFSTYLSTCIDYSKLSDSHTKSLDQIRVDQCYSKIHAFPKFMLWLFYIYFALKVVQIYLDAKALKDIHQFYKYLLDISDKDLQTISWQVVVSRLMLLKDQNAVTSNVSDKKSKSRIDAHDIANRIMRKENYFIALYNKEILDLTLPIPGYRKNLLTRTLEWNLNLCISGFVFNESGQIRQSFLKEAKRKELADELSKRFMLAGILNIVLAPLIVTYFILLYFFRYFNEYRRNPGSIGSRQYTPFAEWKFREFNELYHLFQRRLNLSVPEAAKYVDQFPKEKTTIVLKFVAFITGSFAAVLGILSVVDPDMFFNFEITKDRTVLFYISIFGTIWAVCHGAIPEEYQVFDSEASLKQVATYTHFLPQSWEGKYHTEEVKAEFCEYFDLKPFILLREISSLIMTPFILWFSLPKSTNRIVDFFREFSVHVDGLGYVCTFAMFNFDKSKKGLQSKKSISPNDPRKTHYNSGEDKMMKSYLYFMDSYGNNETQRNGRLQRPVRSQPLHHSSYGELSQQQSVTNLANDFGSKSVVLKNRRPPTTGYQNFKAPEMNTSNDRALLGDSFITTMPQTDVNEAEEDGAQNPGVLGLLNQFYKDYEISHN